MNKTFLSILTLLNWPHFNMAAFNFALRKDFTYVYVYLYINRYIYMFIYNHRLAFV